MKKRSKDCIAFLRQLVRTRSLPGQEGEVAELVESEMKRLGFDEVVRDEAGNVIGLCRGQGNAPAMMFNSHLDHVDVGDQGAWPHPPYAAEIWGDRIWGRGTVDIKGPLAAQVHGVGSIISDRLRPPGDVYVTAVVQEETGGLGARHLVKHLKTPLVVVGEPSRNEVRRGHRGRSELILHVKGQSVHAGTPEKAINPLEVVARFVLSLRDLEMQNDNGLGFSTVAPTLLRTDQTSPNVTPGEVWLTCDCRTIPDESGVDMQKRLQTLVESCLIEGASAEVNPALSVQLSYTGMRRRIQPGHPAFLIPSDHPAVVTAVAVLKNAIDLTQNSGVWRFATDGGHFAQAGQTVIGFGPGDDGLAHTVKESIEIAEIEKALDGNRALALEWPAKNL
jgi:putative selenium metabolism hydrolase